MAAKKKESAAPSRRTSRPTFRPETKPEASYRERMATVVDDVALEQARLASLNSTPPHRAATPMPTNAVVLDAAQLRRRLAPLNRVPRLARPIVDLGTVIDDPKTAYVLSFVDGVLPLETILDVAGIPELDVLRVLDRMVADGAIVFAHHA